MADFRIAPFSIYSSSVETGYMADISASFRPHIDLTNMKTDRYGNFNDAPLQGPFTYKYVGGDQYRHVALNEGTDTPSTRPELFHISMSAGTLKVLGPDAIDVNRPRAYYFRDETAKRPLNIRNIRQTTGSTIIGNYSHDYDILQTSGRSINNRAFVEADGVGFSYPLTTIYVSGAKDPDGVLPNFDVSGTNEYVFVERFNAPGGTDVSSRGVLDTYAEEYAPNNDLNVRNRAVRSVLRSDLTRHTPKATDIPPSLPTEYHTDNRNSRIYKKDAGLGLPFVSPGYLPPFSNQSTDLDIDIDISGKKIYWLHPGGAFTDGKVFRSDLVDPTGESIEEIYSIASDNLTKIAVCPECLLTPVWGAVGGGEKGRVFWYNDSDNDVYVARLDGSDATNTGIGFGFVGGIVAVPNTGAVGFDIFYTNASAGEIVRDDSAVTVTIWSPTPGTFLRSVKHDPVEDKLYWIDTVAPGYVQRGNSDGTGIIEDVFVGSTDIGPALYVDSVQRKLYVGVTSPIRILRMNLDGTEIETIYAPTADGYGIGNSLAVASALALTDSPSRIYGSFQNESLDDVVPALGYITSPDKKKYDNAYATHEMPQADLRYRWIQDSAITTEEQLPGHQHSSSVPYGPYTDINFVLSSENGRGDFIGISGSGVDKGGIAVLTPLGSTNFLSKSAGTIFNVYNGPYQYASWNQVRHGYNPLVMQLARESILSLADVPPEKTNLIGNRVRALRAGVTNFKEPNISDNSKPLKHRLAVQPNLNQPTITTSSFKYTYSNNLSNFTTAQIRNRVGTDLDDTGTLYENISDLYLDLSQLNLPTNPVQKFIDLGYSEVFYPSAMNAYLNRTRTRTNYSEVAGTGSDGYDKIFGKQRTFYKEDEIRTLGTASNSQGFSGSSETSFGTTQLYDFQAGLLTSKFSKDASSGVRHDDTSGSEVFCFGTFPGSSPNERYLQFKEAFTGQLQLSMSAIIGFYGTLDAALGGPSVNLRQPSTGDAILLQYKSVATGTTWQTTSSFSITDVTNTAYTQLTSSLIMFGEAVYVRIAQDNFDSQGTSIGYYFDNWGIDDLQVTGTHIVSVEDSLNFSPMATDGIRSFPESASYRNYNGELMGDTDSTMFGSVPIPSLSFLELTHILNVSSSDYVERLTEQISGRNPWYDTYEGYADDARPASKDMSVLPEFRMSEYIPYYIVEKDNNFRAENNKYLTLDGAEITASAATETDSFDVSFFKQYANSGKAEKLYEVADEHRDISKLSYIKLTCKGIKKLLPYNGFYPQNRSVQLGNLLSESLGSHLVGTHESLAGAFPAQAMQGLLKPLMSPGILYNSIKAGIAVDYPIYTGSVPGLAEGTNTPTDFRLNDGSNYRLPFEALLNLKGTLPEGEDNPIRLVSSFVTADNDLSTEDIFKYKFVWDGKKTPLFELGMHNFLAETVDFFLEEGKLSTYQSNPDQQWDEFEADKTYYMDVVLRDEVEMNKFVEYSGSETIIENPSIFGASDGQQGDEFAGGTNGFGVHAPGQAVSIVEGAPGEGLYALAGASSAHGVGGRPGAAYLLQNKLTGLGWKQIQKLTASDATTGSDSYGFSLALDSGSDGLYMCVGAYRGGDTESGRAYIYHSTSAGTLTEQILTASGGSLSDHFGDYLGFSVDIVSASAGIYALAGAWGYGGAYPTAGAGSALLYHSTSVGMTEIALTASDGTPSCRFGGAVSLVSGADSLYALVGAPSINTAFGAGYLYSIADVTDSDTAVEQKLTASDGSAGDLLGKAVSLSSGSGGLYAACAAPEEDTPTAGGTVYVYYVTDINDSDATIEQPLTGTVADENLGYSTSIVSGTDAVYLALGAPQIDDLANGGKSYFYKITDITNTDNTSRQQVASSNPADADEDFGSSVFLISSSNSNTLYAVAGAGSASFAASGSGAAYLFTGTVGTMTSSLSYPGIQQDYKQHGKLFGMALENQYDPGYVAYTPPSFYGEAVARLSFTPTVSTKYSLEEIFNNIKVENILTTNTNRMAVETGVRKSLTTLQNANKMPVSSSINMFGKFFEPSVIFDDNGVPLQVDENEQNKPSWVVSTRFEAPVLDVSSSRYNELYTARNPGAETAFNFEGAAIRTNPRTMWTSYGDVPVGDKGHYFELKQSFPAKLAQDDALTGSLIDICGFNAGSKKIGVVRETKDISEAIVAIPYLENDNANVETTFIDGKYFIMQDRHQFFIQKFGSKSNIPTAAPLPSISDIASAVGTATAPVLGQAASAPTTTTISNAIQLMKKYVIPPHMDFVKYPDIDPFIMYIFEFKHTLKQKELVDIWQGVMPDSALKIEKDNIVISHDVNPSEFFGNLRDPRALGDMKFFVFKVKLKGKQNYFELTKDSTDDARFKFVFQGDPTEAATPLQGSYNWPYDYFSLVEAAKIEVEITLKNKDEE